MSWRRRTYVIHRWIGLAVSLQLLAWSVGGLYFSLVHPDTVHGKIDARERKPAPLDLGRVAISPAEAIDRLRQEGGTVEGIGEVTLHSGREGEPLYELRRKGSVVAVVDARDGHVLPKLDRTHAEELARADFAQPVSVAEAVLISENPPIEVRGRRLPLWRVELDHPRHPRIYFDAITGEVVARRNSWWRVYDFFYMLHLMDYTERERIHHPLLSIAAALAALTSLSGVALWGWRAASRRRAPAAGTP